MVEKENLELKTEELNSEENQGRREVTIEVPEENAVLPMLAMKGIVLFPNISTSFDVGRTKSLAAVAMAGEQDNLIFIAAQKERSVEDPQPNDIYNVGVVCKIKRVSHLDDRIRLYVEGVYRAKITEYVTVENCLSVRVESMPPVYEEGVELSVYLRLYALRLQLLHLPFFCYALPIPLCSRILQAPSKIVPYDFLCILANRVVHRGAMQSSTLHHATHRQYRLAHLNLSSIFLQSRNLHHSNRRRHCLQQANVRLSILLA